MNKKELIAKIAAKAEMSQSDVNKVVAAFVETVTEALQDGEKIALVNFGTFEVVDKKERESRNPRTGDKIKIPAKRVPRFRPGKGFKDAIEGSGK
jgi:DNA-binding protein HU-beta